MGGFVARGESPGYRPPEEDKLARSPDAQHVREIPDVTSRHAERVMRPDQNTAATNEPVGPTTEAEALYSD